LAAIVRLRDACRETPEISSLGYLAKAEPAIPEIRANRKPIHAQNGVARDGTRLFWNDCKKPGALNVLPAIGVYAAIRREKGEPFGFPGGPSFVWEAADAGLVAEVMVWAAQSPRTANEAFNITNCDVFEWRNVWPALAKTLGVEPGPDMPTSVAAYFEENADVWDQIVAKYNLRSRNLRELVGRGDQHAHIYIS
jgi:hypothetical protein